NIDPIAVLEAAREAFDRGAEIAERAEQRLVRWLLQQHFVAAFDHRRQRQEIGHRSSLLRHDPIRAHAIFRGDSILERRVAFVVRPVELNIILSDRKVVQIAAEYAAVGQIVAGPGLGFRPGNVNAVFHSYSPKIVVSGQWAVKRSSLTTTHCPLPTFRFAPRHALASARGTAPRLRNASTRKRPARPPR